MPNVREQRFASLMMQVYDGGQFPRQPSESDPDYFRRIRRMATRVQREQRASKRRTVRAARKANR